MIKKRCPWCGEIISKKIPLGRYYCPSCKNYSKVYRFGGIHIIIYAFGILALIAIDYFWSFHSGWLLLLLYFGVCFILPLEMDTPHFVPRKSAQASVKLLCKYNFLQKRIIFSEKNLFVICFVDDNTVPVSHMLCISTEDVKFTSSNTFESNIKFIPLSANNTDFSKGTKFYIFEGKEKIAHGILKSDVE